MHVVDFSRNHWGEAGTLHLIDEPCPKKAPGRIEHPGCSAQTFPITVKVACGALNDLHPLQQISRLFKHPGAQRVQARRLYRAVEQLNTQCSLQPLQLPGYSGWCPE